MKEAFGARIAALRGERGLLQSELADRTKVKTSTISAIECGRTFPSDSTAVDLLNALNVPRSQHKEILEDLEAERIATAGESPAFKLGKKIRDMISDLSISGNSISKHVGKTQQHFQGIKNGSKLPSPALFLALKEQLRKGGAKESDLRELDRIYLVDIIMSEEKLEWLPPAKRIKIAEAAVSVL